MSIINTQLIVEGTLWSLIAFSVATWTLIVVKAVQHFRLKQQNRRYLKLFWGAKDFQAAANLGAEAVGPVARLAGAGFTALKQAGSGVHDLEHSGERQELLERHLRQQIQKERRSLETGHAVLASIGSTAPFVGLFGTVWGIMQALTAISKTGSAGLDVVAGPIGEALLATGIGIAVAVPAVLAYNYFSRRLKAVWGDLDDFGADFINLAQRADFRIEPAAAAKKDASAAAKAPATAGTREVYA
ncbi:MotA/TolQ/ExbB proton channel family protein [Janthinobacterium sp. 17J80-10]|uniref:MotA/TolQ/ExbB proton channel family protein n=1 Tax=Janthinobacterium sp. 17J80-10 TaxID=2497863 RepID=UPI0010058C34|nr:MotA/TolQ/ExbB proton channel family protein [Janthinobacterium sp. 17J80-10]QAU33958.1 MotA/TolQ/ExbB proton channel family protein [Janthinobacterium sp. 17J80-10]